MPIIHFPPCTSNCQVLFFQLVLNSGWERLILTLTPTEAADGTRAASGLARGLPPPAGCRPHFALIPACICPWRTEGTWAHFLLCPHVFVALCFESCSPWCASQTKWCLFPLREWYISLFYIREKHFQETFYTFGGFTLDLMNSQLHNLLVLMQVKVWGPQD